jgi:hypothetical protein
VHEILAKIARLAVGKAAAFCYAVVVGVAGNIAFNFVQQQQSAPAAMTAPSANQPAGAAAPSVPPPAATIVPQAPRADAVPPPAAPDSPVAPRPEAAAPKLPEPTQLALPNPASMPMPALKPTALPSHPHPAPQAGEPARQIEAAVNPAPAQHAGPALPGASSAPSPASTLPSLGRAIEVAAPQAPPARTATASATPRWPATPEPPRVAAGPTNQTEPPRTWELSDIWHPTRAVEKGLHWAGEQVPGTDVATARPPVTAPSGPIPLWPAATAKPPAPDIAKGPAATTQAKPGPGSGGLY